MKAIMKNPLFFAFLCFCLCATCVAPAIGGDALNVTIEVIRADPESTVIDPKLEDLAKELRPVLNYTGFTMVKECKVRLIRDEERTVMLSSGRLLKLHFMGFEKKEARLIVGIMEKDREIFRTTLLLVDKGNILIGGPAYETGVLLLRIGARF